MTRFKKSCQDFKRTIGGRCSARTATAWMCLVLVTLSPWPAVLSCPYQLPTALLSINGQKLMVEIAHTPDTRACGLSNRKSLQKNTGMLFLFPDTRQRTFWMKDTRIPLSIAFMDEDGSIIQIHQMQANQVTTTYPSFQPARYALEVNQGWFELHGVTPGDTVEMALPGILKIQ